MATIEPTTASVAQAGGGTTPDPDTSNSAQALYAGATVYHLILEITLTTILLGLIIARVYGLVVSRRRRHRADQPQTIVMDDIEAAIQNAGNIAGGVAN